MKTIHDDLIVGITQDYPLLTPALVQALVCQESGGNAEACRFEQRYFENIHVIEQAQRWSARNNGIPTVTTERVMRSMSYGLGQIMGQVARENAYTDRFLSSLIYPERNLNLMCRLLTERFTRHRLLTIDHVILSWNKGPGCRAPNGKEPYLVSVKRFMTEGPF